MLQKMRKYQFLFEELVKRDFKKKYKRTVLGMFWSVLSPLLMLLVMSLVFTQFFGRSTPHYTIYLFSGQLVFSYFTDATNSGMSSLMDNSTIFSKMSEGCFSTFVIFPLQDWSASLAQIASVPPSWNCGGRRCTSWVEPVR